MAKPCMTIGLYSSTDANGNPYKTSGGKMLYSPKAGNTGGMEC